MLGTIYYSKRCSIKKAALSKRCNQVHDALARTAGAASAALVPFVSLSPLLEFLGGRPFFLFFPPPPPPPLASPPSPPPSGAARFLPCLAGPEPPPPPRLGSSPSIFRHIASTSAQFSTCMRWWSMSVPTPTRNIRRAAA